MANLVDQALQLLGNLNPNNQQTPVLGAIRKFNQQTFGEQPMTRILGGRAQSNDLNDLALGFVGGGLTKATKPVTNALRNMKWDQLITHEAAPDIARINHYANQLWKGVKLEPLKVIKEGTKYGVEDGKHRLAAYKALNIRDIPVEIVRKARQPRSPSYEKGGRNLMEWENGDLTFQELQRKYLIALEGKDDYVADIVKKELNRRAYGNK